MLAPYGKPAGHTAQDARKVASSAVGAGISAASTVAALSAAAGLTAVPVAGWIAAAGIAVTVGTIQLVAAIRQGGLRKREAIQKAKELGLPDAALVPAYAVKALESTPEWREKQAAKLLRLRRRRIKILRKDRRIDAKLSLLSAAAQVDAAAQKMQLAAAPAADIPPADLPVGEPAPVWPFVLLIGGGAVAILLMQQRGS